MLHNGCQGIQRCHLHAKISVWWPGISKQISVTIAKCPTCVRQSSLHKKSSYSISVARLSMAEAWNRPVLLSIFCLVTAYIRDCHELQWTSCEFAAFAKSCNLHHITNSPTFLQSNGQVERAIQTAKKLLRQSDDPYTALLTYRSTSIRWCNLSPAELLMGRCLWNT